MSKAVLAATVLAFGALCASALGACSSQPGNVTSATSLRGCIRDDQCDSNELCVFRLCAPRCGDARSCDHGAACFDTGRGAACLLREYNACVDDRDCPTTTACTNGRCTTDCDPDAGEACGDCLNGLCVPGGSSDMPSDMSSDASTLDAGATSACPPATSQCRDGMVVQCDRAGQAQPREACPFACKDGTCVGSCKPGALRCDALVRQQCDDAGTWKPLETCRTMCMPEVCETACVNGTRQCNEDTLMVCRGGRMVALDTCNYVCRSGACTGTCTPGTRQCRSNAVVTCDTNGAWAMPVDCPNACSAGVCTGECAPGSQRCAGATAFQVCDRRGQWSANSECSAGACVDGMCAGVCTPGATQCSDGVALSTCGANGQWGTPVACLAQACEAGMCIDSCAPQNLRCLPGDPAQPQVCNASGGWENAQRCTPTQTCVEGACRGECAPAARRCSPDDARNFQTCGDTGEWQPAMPCGAGQRCAGEGVCGLGNVCPAGESPEWWGVGEGVDLTPNDPRWGGMLETFASGQQSMPAGYAIVFDRQANQLAVTLRTSADDNAAVSDFVYFGITGSATGMLSAHAVRIALVAPNGSDDPRTLSQFMSYEYSMGTWTSTNAQPMWITHPAAWVTTAEPGWVVSFRVDLTAAGVDTTAPFRIALGLHAENDFGALSWTTPQSLQLGDLATPQPRMWPMLDLTAVMCVSRVDVP